MTLATKLHGIIKNSDSIGHSVDGTLIDESVIEDSSETIRDLATDLVSHFDLWPIINELSKDAA